MDPISITASVVGITASCVSAVQALNNLRTRYSNASSTVAALCTESSIISSSLCQIQTLLLRNPDALAPQFESRPELAATFDTALTGCIVVFSRLDEELSTLMPEGLDGEELTWTQ